VVLILILGGALLGIVSFSPALIKGFLNSRFVLRELKTKAGKFLLKLCYFVF